ncbi:hypothetical protein EW146_g7087 [Bondarzewia mesenterica]|uniref:NACHT domain-containing protein n=1 Tax=Bondarzewia mesenterica TaxID=1095465 RepID=A0A4S4LLR5_9AGAM|nr:hypothetical protein EW146_g7087 [Bondarzewia mesenterica]
MNSQATEHVSSGGDHRPPAADSVTGLIAHLSGIEVMGALEKKRPSIRPDHYVVVCIDAEKRWKSKKKRFGGGSPRWDEESRLPFRPSSVIKVEIFRESLLASLFPRKRYLVGRYSGKVSELLENGSDTIFDLTDDTGAKIQTQIKIQLSLVLDSVQDTMERIKHATSRLDDSNVVTTISGTIDAGASAAQTGYEAAQALGSCVKPLGQALEVMARLLQTFSDAMKAQGLQDDAVRVLAESLYEMLGAAKECPDLTAISGTENVIEEIGRASLEVASVIDEYTKLSFSGRTLRSALSSNIANQVQQCQRRCDDLTKKFDRRVAVTTHKDVRTVPFGHQIRGSSILTMAIAAVAREGVRELQQGAQRAQLDALRDKIYEWLSAPDPSVNYNEAREKFTLETGKWFIDGRQFADWKEKAGSFLWIYGMPGSGKTILSSSAIEHIKPRCDQDASRAFAYFFFDSRDSQEERQAHDKLIRSLIKQLSAKPHNLSDALVKLYDNGQHQPLAKNLEETLQLIIQEFEDVYIVIDALDECHQRSRSKLLKWIGTVTESTGGKLHLLVTSRKEPDVEKGLSSLSSRHGGPLCVESESSNADIRIYLDSMLQLDEMQKWDDANRERIKATLLERCEGMFRWIALQLESLQTCFSPHQLDEQLNDLPKGVDETYARILARISHPEDARKILQWLAFSARELSLEEVAHIPGIHIDSEHGPCFDRRRIYQDPQSILRLCSGLVPLTEETGKIKLAHFSVKEYLLSEAIREGTASTFSFSEKIAHEFISKTCLVYLLQFDDHDPIDESTIGQFPLAFYAAEYWLLHARFGGDALQELVMKLLQRESAPLISWVRLYDLEHPWYRTNLSLLSTDIPSPLYYASLAGLEQASQTLLANGADVNAQGGEDGNALQVASKNGHESIVKLLLEKGADVNAQGGRYGNALQAASENGHESIVKLLLEKGAEKVQYVRDVDPL